MAEYSLHKEYYKEKARKWHKVNPLYKTYLGIKKRAADYNEPIDFSYEDYKKLIADTTICPILGIKMEQASGTPKSHSPSIDRIDSSKGYTLNNIQVISFRANVLKRNATLDELIRLGEWAKGQQRKTENESSSL